MLLCPIIVVRTYFKIFLGADSENHSHFSKNLVGGRQQRALIGGRLASKLEYKNILIFSCLFR